MKHRILTGILTIVMLTAVALGSPIPMRSESAAAANSSLAGYLESAVPLTPIPLNLTPGVLNGSYRTQEQIDACVPVIEQIIRTYLTTDMSEFERASILYHYLRIHVRYSSVIEEQSSNEYGALIRRAADCWGYASAYQLLCQAAGLECYFVIPKNSGNDMHRWNIVRIDGTYYHVDPQGGVFLEETHPYFTDDIRNSYPVCSETAYQFDPANFDHPVVLYAGECGDQGDNLTFRITSDGEMLIKGEGNLEWSYEATMYTQGAKTITFQDGITSINAYAFVYYFNLETITIPDTVTEIGSNAFRQCENLKSVIIPDSVTKIGEDAFTGCPELTICGNAGSAAEKYAADNGIAFSLIGSYPAVSGDLNGDNAVTAADAVLLARFLAEDDTLSAEQRSGIRSTNPDLDNDGQLTLLDVTVILKKISAQ